MIIKYHVFIQYITIIDCVGTKKVRIVIKINKNIKKSKDQSAVYLVS